MQRLFPIFLLAGVITVLSPSATAQDDETVFASAISDFEAGRYDKAANQFRALAEKGKLSEDLYYNLGASLYKQEVIGEAALWFRRAQRVDPAMPEARQSLQFLRTRTGWLEFTEGEFDRFVRGIPPALWRWCLSLSIWLTLFAIALVFYFRAKRRYRAPLIALTILGAFLTGGILWLKDYREERLSLKNIAIVVKDDAKARTTPTPDASEVIKLPPGSELRIVQQSGTWIYADIPGNLRGWVRSTEVQPVWPIPQS